MDNPTVFWSIVGAGGVLVVLSVFFLVRFAAERTFERYVRRLFEKGHHDLAAEKLSARGRQREAAEMLLRWGKVEKAAQLVAQVGDWLTAAQLSERARQWGTAAVYYLKADDRLSAAECFANQGRADRAAELYLELGELDLAVEALRQSGDYEGAANLQLDHESVEAAIETLSQGGRIREAAELLRMHGNERSANLLLANYYDNREEWVAAAEAYEALEQLEDAAQRYRLAGEHLKVGEIYERLERWEDAKNYYLRVSAFDRAARCFEKLKDFREAARHFLLAGQLKQALDNLHRAQDVVSVGQIYERFGFADQALDVLNVPPEHGQFKEARVLRARMLERRGDVEKAREELMSILNRVGLTKDNVDVAYMVAELHVQGDDPAGALKILERVKAQGLSPRDLDERITRLRQVVSPAAPGAEVNPATQLSAGLPIHDRYDFLQKLGQGGMGAVYKARDKRLGRIVAIKMLLESNLPTEMAKKYFFREAQTVSVLNHPNIVTIYDFGEIESSPFIAMEYIEGRNLEQMVSGENRVLPLDRVGAYCSQLAVALEYAHKHKVIHRDVKLGNVMVTQEEVVKLMDFGLAKAITENPDRSLLVIGTPYYMAPEQIAHEGVDHRVDIYALGVLLFRLVTGRLPFESGDVLRSQRFDQPPDPSIFNPTIPPELSELILACLEKKAGDRPARAIHIAERLNGMFQ